MKRRFLSGVALVSAWVALACVLLQAAPRARPRPAAKRPRPAAKRPRPAARPKPARRANWVQTHRQNVGSAIGTRRENVGGAIGTRRENVGGAIGTRRENVGGAVATRRENIAAYRRTLPAVTPVTITTDGVVEVPPAEPAPPPPAPPAAPPAPPAPPGPGAPAEPAPPVQNAESKDQFGGSDSYKVLRIEDEGTTVVLRIGGEESKVRMIGVAPMSLKAGKDVPMFLAARRRLPSTTTFLQLILKGESLYVVYDSRIDECDKGGKYVAYLYRAPDGLLINQEVIRNGFAAADTRYDYDLKDTFVKYQKKAQQAEKGIFGMLKALAARRSMMRRE